MNLRADMKDATSLADDVLASHFTLATQPGGLTLIETDGVSGWTCENPHPVLSTMRWTTRDESLAAAAVDNVVSEFRSQGRGFDWMTGPSTAHLVPMLYERDFIDPPLDVAAMVCPLNQSTPAPELDGLTIWKVQDINDPRVYSVMAKGFDVPDEVGGVYHSAYLAETASQRSDVFAVSEIGSDDPVAVGYLSYIGQGPSVLLRVSSTLESHRGRGIYTALVLHRMREAFAAGRHQAFVHAYSTGSRNALGKLGFKSVGQLQLHRWRP